MKFLEAKALGDKQGGENKMKEGTRSDQFVRKGQLHPDNPPATKREVVDLAKSLGVDLKNVKGTGTGGEVTLKDVKDAKAKSQLPDFGKGPGE